MTTELTPAVQDAAYRLGWAMEAVGASWAECDNDIFIAMSAGADAFTPEAEAERVEMVREASVEAQWADDDDSWGEHMPADVAFELYNGPILRRLCMNDTQGQIPDASMVMQWKDEQ